MPRGKLIDVIALGPVRRRRRMHRLLRELDRRDAGLPPRRRGSGEVWHRLWTLGTAVVVILVVALVVLNRQWGITLGLHGLHRSVPLGRPPAVPSGRGPYRFEHTQPGRPDVPVAYDPCRPIHVVVNDALAPPAASGLLGSALREVSHATGLSFVVDGTTDELPSQQRPGHDPARYGLGWSPVLVAWTTPGQLPTLAGKVVGLGGSALVLDPLKGLEHYVTGQVSLDAPALTDMLRQPGGRGRALSVLLHELGHVVGLGHVHDRGEIMNPDVDGLTAFGPGDREGLAVLGEGQCFP